VARPVEVDLEARGAGADAHVAGCGEEARQRVLLAPAHVVGKLEQRTQRRPDGMAVVDRGHHHRAVPGDDVPRIAVAAEGQLLAQCEIVRRFAGRHGSSHGAACSQWRHEKTVRRRHTRTSRTPWLAARAPSASASPATSAYNPRFARTSRMAPNATVYKVELQV